MRAVVLLALLCGCGRAVRPQPPAPFEERLLATLPEGARLFVPPVFSRDGRACAYVARTAEGDRVVRGEWRSERRALI